MGFKEQVLRKILVFGTMGDKTTRDWRKWHNEKLRFFYFYLYDLLRLYQRRLDDWL